MVGLRLVDDGAERMTMGDASGCVGVVVVVSSA